MILAAFFSSELLSLMTRYLIHIHCLLFLSREVQLASAPPGESFVYMWAARHQLLGVFFLPQVVK